MSFLEHLISFIDRNRFFSFAFALLIFFSFITNFMNLADQHFLFLARSFLQGKIHFVDDLGDWGDTALYIGHYYWPLGPFPALLMTPFVFLFSAFGGYFLQGYLNFILILLVFYFVYKISRKIGYKKNDSLLWAITFVFGSAFIGVAVLPWSWYLSHSVVVLLVLVALYEQLTHKRYWLIGILFAFILATRVTTWLAISFFLMVLVFGKKLHRRIKLLELFELFFPSIVVLVSLIMYNYTRFDNYFEFGYSYQILDNIVQQRRGYGLFSIVHIPANLYFMFIKSPSAVLSGEMHLLTAPYVKSGGYGMSIFVTSPYFFYLFTVKKWNNISKYLLLSVLLVLMPVLVYYGIGAKQYGYRYSLDFLPLLYFLLMLNYVKVKNSISNSMRMLLWSSVFANVFLCMVTFMR